MNSTPPTLTFDPDVPGHVYLIEQDGEHKIGYSACPGQRLSQVADPKRAKIIHLIPSIRPAMIERTLHNRFALSCIHGEWFRLEQEDIDAIVAVSRTDTIQDLPPDLQRDCRPLSLRTKQVNVRLSPDILDHLDIIERAHGLDTSSAIRMILTESRHSIVERARQILKDRGEQD